MSITNQVREYINERPTVLACLRNNLVNYSALARQISKDLKLKETNFDAVLVACRRYYEKLSKDKAVDYEEQVRTFLKRAKLKIRTQLFRVILDPKTRIYEDITPLHFIKGNSGITIVFESEDYDKVKKMYDPDILDIRKNLAEVSIVSRKQADKLPGLTAYLSNLLVSKGVNVLTVLGSYVDDIFIIEQRDLAKVLELFKP